MVSVELGLGGLRAQRRNRLLWAKIRADAVLYYIVGLYVAAALVLGRSFNRGGVESLGLYIDAWFLPAVCGTALLLALRFFVTLARAPQKRPIAELRALFGGEFLGNLLSGLVLFYGLCLFLGAFTLVKNGLPLIRPFYFDRLIADADQRFHLGHDPWTLLQPVLGGSAMLPLQFCYYYAWPFIVGLCPLLLAISKGDRGLRSQFLLAFVLAWIVLGTFMAGLFMSGGPIFYGRLTGDLNRYAAMNAYLSAHALPVADHLWRAYQQQQVGFGTGISDFPSMHVTMVTLVTLLSWRLRPAIGVATSLFALLIVMTSVHLGWHYALGDYITILGTCALWWTSGVLVRSRAWREIAGPERPGSIRP